MLDLALGNEDGLEVLPLLARHNPATVVVLASGFDGRILAASQRVAASLGVRVAGVLRKPILPTALQRVLGQAPGILLADQNAMLDIAPGRIRNALAEGQITPWFQPKTSLATGTVVGAEALARWMQPDGRAISPALFIAVAERNGLIGELTDAMLNQALQACAHWRTRRPDCWVSVNLSPLLLNDPGLTDRIERSLEQHGVPTGALVLEITENNGIPDTACAMKSLTRLRICGVNLSIDDFGTGHSSMLSLIRMPFNEEAMQEILAAFIEDIGANLTLIQEAAAQGDTRAVYRLAHIITGAARNVGATMLANRAAALEQQVGSLSLTSIGAEIRAMQIDFDAAMVDMKSAMAVVM